MASDEYKIKLTADNQISDEAKDAADALDAIPENVDVTIDADASPLDRVKAALDEVAVEARETGEAAETLARALGPELGAKADTTSIVGELRNMGLTLEDIKTNADELATKLREVADADVGGRLGQGLGTARGETERLADSARGANSALANMIGNSAQDLGALGGVAGSVGVAFGQMGEYAADAALGGERLGSALKSMALVAGPIALLAAAMQAVQGVLAIHEKRAEAAAARTEELGAAMEGAADPAVGLADALRQSNEELANFETTDIIGNDFVQGLNDIAASLPLIGGLAQDLTVDVGAAVDEAGSNLYRFADAVTGSVEEGQRFLDLMYAQYKAGVITGDQYRAIAQSLQAYRDAAAAAGTEQARWNVGVEEANAIIDELAAKADPLSQMGDTWATLFADLADGKIDTQEAADAINLLSDALGLTQEQIIQLAADKLAGDLEDAGEAAQQAAEDQQALVDALGEVNDAFDGTGERVAALGRAFEDFNAGSDLDFSAMAVDTVESFDDIKAALAEVQDIGSKPLVPTAVEDLRGLSDESAAVVDALGGMRQAIQTELGAALEDAGGNFDGLREKAGFFREEITGQFTSAFEEMGLGPAEVEEKVTELLGSLGLLPSQVETVIKLSQAEEAMRKIELFGGAIEGLPAEVQAKVAAAIDVNDPVTAWNAINEGVQAQGAVTVDMGANTAPAEEAAAAFDPGVPPPFELTADPALAEDTAAEFTDTERTTTPVDIDASSVLAAGIMLAFLTAKRTTTIDVNANVLPAVASILSVLNAPKNTTIAVGTSGLSGAESAINSVARDRTVTIRPNVVPTSVLVRVDGGG